MMHGHLVVTPQGHLRLDDGGPEAAGADPAAAGLGAADGAALAAAFAESAGAGLLKLANLDRPGLPAEFAFWREFGREYLTRLCHVPDLSRENPPELPPPILAELTVRAEQAPPMRGLEYLNSGVLESLWRELDGTVRAGLRAHPGPATEYLQALNPLWRLVGRVTFHLAENKKNAVHPFAFLATYTSRISAQAKPQYLPLNRALQEYAGAQNKAALLSLLQPVQRAAETSPLAAALVKSGGIYQPQVWSPQDAYRFLQEIPRFEAAGVLVRVPDWWQGGKPPRPRVSVSLGGRPASVLGVGAMLSFDLDVSLNGEKLDAAEIRNILASAAGLTLIKGRWAEVDRDKLQAALAHFEAIQKEAADGGISFHDGMRLLAGVDQGLTGGGLNETGIAAVREWADVAPGPWLKQVLADMRAPEQLATAAPPPGLRAELRPDQQTGLNWLWFMHRIGLGACLADDMGLGKTIQVLALLLRLKTAAAAAIGNAASLKTNAADGGRVPSLLVAPASLLGNWQAEIAKFAPDLRVLVAHPAETPAAELAEIARAPGTRLATFDLVITTYGMLARQDWLLPLSWSVAALDEAQAIKNPGSRQARAVKKIQARHRIVLTGTPVENRLGDLWSLFDFLNPGLLGTAEKFARYSKNLAAAAAQTGGQAYAPLRALTRPYILRRLKTDRRIINDLPDKTEVDAFCTLTPTQATLYRESVRQLEEQLESADGIQRRGLVLAFLMRFKQICNHPAQWLGNGDYAPAASGKFQRLRELGEELAERQEKALIFTQFREMCEPLQAFLSTIFGRPGLVLHGGTPVARRGELVAAFQREDGPPFFVLSLKAGGTGLNLTAATQVIHFDRWWNPAVENQATDRAFRLGQKHNVLVHKFICRGTLEEKIAALIAGKRDIADAVLGEGGEKLLTEMTDAELLRFVALDLERVAEA